MLSFAEFLNAVYPWFVLLMLLARFSPRLTKAADALRVEAAFVGFFLVTCWLPFVSCYCEWYLLWLMSTYVIVFYFIACLALSIYTTLLACVRAMISSTLLRELLAFFSFSMIALMISSYLSFTFNVSCNSCRVSCPLLTSLLIVFLVSCRVASRFSSFT